MSAEFHSGTSFYHSQWVAVCRLPSCRREVDSMFDEIIHRVWGRSEWQPAADLLETTHTYILEIDLPGIEENTVQVKVVDRRLIVEGDRKIQYPEDLVQMHVSERPAGRFIRSFEFKDLLDLERIKRFHSNGILTLIIPKQNSEEGV